MRKLILSGAALLFVALLILTLVHPGRRAEAQSSTDVMRTASVRIGPKLPAACNPTGAAGSAGFLLTVTDGLNLPGVYRCSAANTWSGPALNTSGSGQTVKKVFSRTASLDFTALAANSCEDLDVTGFIGLSDGDPVFLGVPVALANNSGSATATGFTAFVKNSTTVSVRRCNPSGSTTFNPAAATVRVAVSQF